MDCSCPKCTYSNVNGRIFCEMCRHCAAKKKISGSQCPPASIVSDRMGGSSSSKVTEPPASRDRTGSLNDVNGETSQIQSSNEDVDRSQTDETSSTNKANSRSEVPSCGVAKRLSVSHDTEDQAHIDVTGSLNEEIEGASCGLSEKPQSSNEKVDRSPKDATSSRSKVNDRSGKPSCGVAKQLPVSHDTENQAHTDVTGSLNSKIEGAYCGLSKQVQSNNENGDKSPKDATSSSSTVNDRSEEPSCGVAKQLPVSHDTEDQAHTDLVGSLNDETEEASGGLSEQIQETGGNENHFQTEECSPNVEIESQKDKEIRLVLIGRTGAGKSATGNTILKKNTFASLSSPSSVTRECVRDACLWMGYHVQVIDTPGMFDTEMDIGEITREIVRCVTMTAPGPHAFIVIIKPDRFTEEEQKTIGHFINIFGESMKAYMIVLFTKRDQLAADGSSIEQYIEHGNEKLKNFLHSCNNRYVAFNNRGTDEEKEQDVKNLLTMVLSMVELNNGVYTNSMFEEAEKLLREQEELLEREHKAQVDQEVARIIAECDRDIKELRGKHREEILELQERILSLERQTLQGVEETDMENIDQLYEEVKMRRNRLDEQMRRIEEIAGATIEEARKKPNFRETLREKVARGGAFFIKNILPVLRWVTDTIVPLVAALVKR